MGYLNMVDSFIYMEPVFRAKLDALAENDAHLKDNGWQTSCKGVFFQAAAPSGWTKDTTNNDKFLRVVNTTGTGTGGASAPSSAITLAHSAHSITAAPAHTHDIANHTHNLDNAASNSSGTPGTVTISSKSGFLYARVNNAGGSLTEVQMRSRLNATSFLTSGSDGAHSHGGNSTGSALSNITFAYCDVIVCSKNSGGGTYTDETSEFSSGDIIEFNPFDAMADNDVYNQARLMPATSVMVFGQAVTPTGWTKETSTDDKLLRVVSGTGGGTGGSQAPSSAITMTHTHGTSTDTGHSHTVGAHSHDLNFDSGVKYNPDGSGADAYMQADGSDLIRNSGVGGPSSSHTCYRTSTTSAGTGNTATNASHSHVLGSSGTNFQLAYFDLIQCSKNSAGAPYTYTDITSLFAFKKLVSKQKLNTMAKNDEHILYHTPETGTKSFFFMTAAPLTWTKITSQHDKGLRMVSGSSGGSSGGGAQLMSVALPLAHTHPINSVGHTHTIGTHTHVLDTGSQTTNNIGTNGVAPTGANNVMFLASNSGSANTLKTTAGAGSGTSDSVSHDHGGTSGSALSDIVLAYADVIYCQKD